MLNIILYYFFVVTFLGSVSFIYISSLIKHVEITNDKVLLINGRNRKFKESLSQLKHYYLMRGNVLYVKFSKKGYRIRKNEMSIKLFSLLNETYPGKNQSQFSAFLWWNKLIRLVSDGFLILWMKLILYVIQFRGWGQRNLKWRRLL